MKVIDIIEKVEKDLSYDQLVDLVANHNRQVDLIFAEKRGGGACDMKAVFKSHNRKSDMACCVSCDVNGIEFIFRCMLNHIFAARIRLFCLYALLKKFTALGIKICTCDNLNIRMILVGKSRTKRANSFTCYSDAHFQVGKRLPLDGRYFSCKVFFKALNDFFVICGMKAGGEKKNSSTNETSSINHDTPLFLFLNPHPIGGIDTFFH